MDEEQCMHCANVVAQRQAEQGGGVINIRLLFGKEAPRATPLGIIYEICRWCHRSYR